MANRFQSILGSQQSQLLSAATKSCEWRLDQADGMERMLCDQQEEFCAALCQDFRKPSFESLCHVKHSLENLHALMAQQPAAIPKGLEASGGLVGGHAPPRACLRPTPAGRNGGPSFAA